MQLLTPLGAVNVCRLHTVTAEMIMATGVVGFRPVESVANVLAALHTSTHNGFPIAFADSADASFTRHIRQNNSHGNLVSIVQLASGKHGAASPTPLAPAVLHDGQLSPTDVAAAAKMEHAIHVAAAAGAAAAGSNAPGTVMTVEGGRLEGVILRSQLLVLLQRRHFCDQHGRPVGREYSEKEEIDLEVGCGGLEHGENCFVAPGHPFGVLVFSKQQHTMLNSSR